MPPKRDPSSATPMASTEKSDGSHLPAGEWEAMQRVLNAIYEYRTPDELNPSKLFHKQVNSRHFPDYYQTVQTPMAMSIIKLKIKNHEYKSLDEFVRDFALIPHNAFLYNTPSAGAYQDAIIFKERLEGELQALVAEGVMKPETAILPDLGEIPTYTAPEGEMDGEGEEGEEESDEDAEGEEDDEDEDEGGAGRKRKRGRPPLGRGKSGGEDAEARKRRGRPPKLLTPTEARIQGVLKGIRKPRNKEGVLAIKAFDKLPEKSQFPDYYQEVKNPMAYDLLKRKVKRKKYATFEQFMQDVNLMFTNAKSYNTDDSQIFKDAVALQIEAGKLYDAEKAKPDESFADEEGKLPMPNGVFHNGENYKVGDWVHIRNPNDLTKPVPAQIYRTFKNPKGEAMVNVCWYYRPEQTVHRFDKHFFPNEVVKTGRYRDHNIEEVEAKCFVMFYTRYFKGRPRNLPSGIDLYVCAARYNEVLHQFNVIKTWASCQPDEIRDQDYEMDLFQQPQKMRKVQSPIAYMLRDDQKETDELPKVQWGAEGAPPKIGAVHRKPRGEKDSPPPEPTPPPPPKMPTPPPRQLQSIQSNNNYNTPSISQQQSARQPIMQQQAYTAPRPTTTNYPSASPAPQRPPSATHQHPSYNLPQTPQTAPQPPPTRPQLASNPSSTYGHQSQAQPTATPALPPNPANYPPPRAPTASYRDPPQIEVYTLPDQANLSIPPEIRDQYQRDAAGRVLFFTAPPTVVEDTPGKVTGHSVRYLAAKARRAELLAQKRKERDETLPDEQEAAKKIKLAEETAATQARVEALKARALKTFEEQMAVSAAGTLSERDLEVLEARQKAVRERQAAVEVKMKERRERREVKLGPGRLGFGEGSFADEEGGRGL
ncbi:hypothetical protein MBLNU230_g1407t1 [Neophaeotheca triangularis]